jgi:DNA-binding winged helix-turn-helix (wHTH) protein
MHVARLREKLRDTTEEPRVLLTVRGKGYMLARVDGSDPSTLNPQPSTLS